VVPACPTKKLQVEKFRKLNTMRCTKLLLQQALRRKKGGTYLQRRHITPFFSVFSILSRTKKNCGTASTDINCLILYVVVRRRCYTPCLPALRGVQENSHQMKPRLSLYMALNTSLWSLPTKLNWAHAAATVEGTTDLRFKAEEEQFLLRSSISIC